MFYFTNVEAQSTVISFVRFATKRKGLLVSCEDDWLGFVVKGSWHKLISLRVVDTYTVALAHITRTYNPSRALDIVLFTRNTTLQ